jgi:hypothetical protein
MEILGLVGCNDSAGPVFGARGPTLDVGRKITAYTAMNVSFSLKSGFNFRICT